MTITFEAGLTYSHLWACDADAVTCFEVVGRTAKFITAREVGSIEAPKRMRVNLVKITRDDGAVMFVESVKPHGTYSMSPTMFATDEAAR